MPPFFRPFRRPKDSRAEKEVHKDTQSEPQRTRSKRHGAAFHLDPRLGALHGRGAGEANSNKSFVPYRPREDGLHPAQPRAELEGDTKKDMLAPRKKLDPPLLPAFDASTFKPLDVRFESYGRSRRHSRKIAELEAHGLDIRKAVANNRKKQSYISPWKQAFPRKRQSVMNKDVHKDGKHGKGNFPQVSQEDRNVYLKPHKELQRDLVTADRYTRRFEARNSR